jgi:hypothetical protein
VGSQRQLGELIGNDKAWELLSQLFHCLAQEWWRKLLWTSFKGHSPVSSWRHSRTGNSGLGRVWTLLGISEVLTLASSFNTIHVFSRTFPQTVLFYAVTNVASRVILYLLKHEFFSFWVGKMRKLELREWNLFPRGFCHKQDWDL